MASYVDYTSDLINSAPPYVREEDIIDSGCTGSVTSELTDAATNLENAVHALEDAEKLSDTQALSVNGVNPFKNHLIDIIAPLSLNYVALNKFNTGITNAPTALNEWDTTNFNKSEEWKNNYQTKYNEEIKSKQKELARRINNKIDAINQEDPTKNISHISSSTDIGKLNKSALNYGVSLAKVPLGLEEAIKQMPNYQDCINGNYGITYLVYSGNIEGLTLNNDSLYNIESENNINSFNNFYASNDYWQNVGKDFSENFDFSNAKNILDYAGIAASGTFRTLQDVQQVAGNALFDTASNVLECAEWIFPSAYGTKKEQMSPSSATNPYNSDYWNSLGQNFAENWDYTGCKNVWDYVEQTGDGVINTVWDVVGVPVHAVADTGQAVIEMAEYAGNWLFNLF